MSTEIIYFILYVYSIKISISNVNGEFTKSLFKELERGEYTVQNFTEITAQYGYKSEEHSVVTEDGYILTVFRIPRGKNCHRAVRMPPVLIMHGLLQSSDSWIDSGPEAGLAFLLSDDCFDLWVGNVRGNHYSRRHLILNPDKDPEFWQFSLNEVGVYDLPCTIDYILDFTASDKLNYIGFSQSGGSMLIMCSERPKYCNKVGIAILLHPASRMKNSKSKPFKLVTRFYELLEPNLRAAEDLEVLPQGGQLHQISNSLCHDYETADTFCRSILSAIDSYHRDSIAVPTIQTLASHFPAGTSVRTMTWFSQSFGAKEFRNIDYGSAKNLKTYGNVKPREYKINATTIPVVIIHGRNDYIVSPKDAEWLRERLPNLLEFFYVKDPSWNHFDVTYSRHTKKMIYPKIIEYLSKYSDTYFWVNNNSQNN